MNAQPPPNVPDLGRDRLATQLRALAHPARLAVLETLARQDSCMCGEIVRGLPLAQSTVSQHIKILVEAGLIRASVSGSRTCYCIDKAALAALRDDVQALFEGLRLGAAGPLDGIPAVAAVFEVGIHD
ncbi:ArsR/SmtB family transcription factor [Azorhizobium doebereinerae]|uniref:ArsR/SmtB family transcription factor n=1 Tax=Azorhizobium doebereinerae TaxID=281091 RepID=UPI000421DA82|nr:metalloregulator ArsR/SmtB family transcription factor [Azorhizobium doebereinerae]